MTLRVPVAGELLRWACERNGHALYAYAYAVRFPKLGQRASGDAQPTLKQLEQFANATHTPVGYLFLASAFCGELTERLSGVADVVVEATP